MSRNRADTSQPNHGAHSNTVEDADDEIWPEVKSHRQRLNRAREAIAMEPRDEKLYSYGRSIEILHRLAEELGELRLKCDLLQAEKSDANLRSEQEIYHLREEIRRWRDFSNRLLQRLKSAEEVMQDAAKLIAVTNARTEEANTSALDANQRLFLMEKFVRALHFKMMDSCTS